VASPHEASSLRGGGGERGGASCWTMRKTLLSCLFSLTFRAWGKAISESSRGTVVVQVVG